MHTSGPGGLKMLLVHFDCLCWITVTTGPMYIWCTIPAGIHIFVSMDNNLLEFRHFRLLLTVALLSLPDHYCIKTDQKSPYNQYLPNCTDGSFKAISKITNIGGIVCPMIKDEIGFLSEWTAYHEMQGFSHIIFFDNNSTTSFAELDPWLKSGYVTIERNWWLHEKNVFGKKSNKFNDMMKIKLMAEVRCKQEAVRRGYEIFVSVDMDEYVMPSRPDVTVMDELVAWFNQTTRGFALLDKLQFPPTPHILEPVNLLTIEAYQTRMTDASRMNYYTSVCKSLFIC